MTTEEAMQYELDVINSGKYWVEGKSSINNRCELLILAEHFNIKLPVCMSRFEYSTSPNDVCATGAHKTIFKVLDKLAIAIKTSEERG